MYYTPTSSTSMSSMSSMSLVLYLLHWATRIPRYANRRFEAGVHSNTHMIHTQTRTYIRVCV